MMRRAIEVHLAGWWRTETDPTVGDTVDGHGGDNGGGEQPLAREEGGTVGQKRALTGTGMIVTRRKEEGGGGKVAIATHECDPSVANVATWEGYKVWYGLI